MMRRFFKIKVPILTLGVFLAAPLLVCEEARAVLVLKQVQVANGKQVELQFDRDVDVKAIKTEFYQDIIQLSLNNVSVYPPKIFSVESSEIAKVFAYQYTPKLVRCRLTVKGNAEDFKSRISLRSKGKFLTLVINAIPVAKDRLTFQAAKAVSAPSAPAKKIDRESTPASSSTVLKPEDRATFDKILHTESKETAEPSATKGTSHLLTGGSEKTIRHSTSGSSMSRLVRTFAWMTIVLILMAGVLVVLKKALKSKSGSKGWLAKMMKGKFGASGKLIEVEATHYLGPKKSIAVVKVQGRRLVLGITDESINLITQLGEGDSGVEEDLLAGLTGAPAQPKPRTPEPRRMGTGAMAAGPGRFSDILASADVSPSFRTPESNQRIGGSAGSVRDQIRKRVEGLKNL